MRIFFDLDDTLVVRRPGAKTDPPPCWPWRLFFREPLREGTRDVLRTLIQQGHEVWIYTTSFRRPLTTRLWFRAVGVRLDGVVNGAIHASSVSLQPPPSKHPPTFGIDLHVDDSEGVLLEGRRHGFPVVVVPPDRGDWVKIVLRAVNETEVSPTETARNVRGG